MRARIRQRGAYFLSVLIVGCALVVARPAQGGQAQEQKKEPESKPPAAQLQSQQLTSDEWRKQRHLEELQEIERRQAAKAAQDQQAHAPEIDGASIPTALALMSASVLLLRARLRAK